MQEGPSEAGELLCHRCGAILHPGRGDLYVIRIEALADPFPPVFSAEELEQNFQQAVRELLEEMKDASEQDLLNDVYRCLVLYLCRPCYLAWMEDPVGGRNSAGR